LGSSAAGVDCNALVPQPSSRETYSDIVGCLGADERLAVLVGGVYSLPRGLRLPPHSRLIGLEGTASDDRPQVRIAFPSSMTDFVIATDTNTTVSGLVFDAAQHLTAGRSTSVVQVHGSDSVIQDVEARNNDVGVGVYFLNTSSADNLFLRVHVRNCRYGVIFAPGLDRLHGANIFEAGIIQDVACDAITFAGYGEAVGNVVHDTGFNCSDADPPHPGAGFYCSGNTDGGLIVENTIFDTCGMALDIDSCANFNVSFNTAYDPGNTFGGQRRYCAGSATFMLLDSRDFHVEGNTVMNSRPSNMRSRSPWGDPHRIFADVDAAPFSDLPGGSSALLNFVLAQRPQIGAQLSVGHEIVSNVFKSACAKGGRNSDCIGVGYYAGRGTGLDGTLAGRPSRYLTNTALGSDRESRRCGVNLYSVHSSMCLQGISPLCNEDDYQYTKKNFRNDLGCGDYAARVGSPQTPEPGISGRIRVPLH